jgi:hypothetical protein
LKNLTWKSKNIRGKCLFVHINLSADFEEGFDMIMNKPTEKLLIMSLKNEVSGGNLTAS